MRSKVVGRVLVVEDEGDLVRLLEVYLRLHGIEVVAAATVAEALERTAGIDVLLTDLCLPDGDGMRLVATIRRLSPGLPVVVMSGQVLARCVTDDDIVLLPKPFVMRELASLLLAMVGTSTLRAA